MTAPAKGTAARKPRVLLAASGGGHVRQLLDLEGVWRGTDYVFVTEDTSLGRSLARDHPVRFVAHYAWGQMLLGRKRAMVAGLFANLRQSWRIVRETRPDIVITSGAGAVFLTAVFARLSGTRLVAIESFARVDRPSKFGRLIRRFADLRVVQSRALLDHWPDAELFDPLRTVDGPRPEKEPLTFATVGATLPFPRLRDSVVREAGAGRLVGEVILQVGDDPDAAGLPHVNTVQHLDFAAVQDILRRAELVICHGGTGSLVTALRAGCRVVAMPRRFDLGEHYDNHQEEITEAFAARGLITLCRDADRLGEAVAEAMARPPVLATTDHGPLAARLKAYLESA